MKNRIMVVAAVVVLTACKHWQKDGATREDFSRDKQYCQVHAHFLGDGNA
jgi:hypothetical protein